MSSKIKELDINVMPYSTQNRASNFLFLSNVINLGEILKNKDLTIVEKKEIQTLQRNNIVEDLISEKLFFIAYLNGRFSKKRINEVTKGLEKSLNIIFQGMEIQSNDVTLCSYRNGEMVVPKIDLRIKLKKGLTYELNGVQHVQFGNNKIAKFGLIVFPNSGWGEEASKSPYGYVDSISISDLNKYGQIGFEPKIVK